MTRLTLSILLATCLTSCRVAPVPVTLNLTIVVTNLPTAQPIEYRYTLPQYQFDPMPYYGPTNFGWHSDPMPSYEYRDWTTNGFAVMTNQGVIGITTNVLWFTNDFQPSSR